ncbi:ABC transporter substrate-binding protein [Spartinivicinus poritis]|uniref:ABC transporter substrate-binding protein n=1 Tax=Spartinivicinus poritis TaxID=2994640 RepID=A0ABT5U8P0_9GAMM|nr:ABC transporter substrate-binding protein [Spartinivicinus sp. A2-2]MDE1461907.1 ABC transporter substrate-binding protein [Spartinivicinus sp. A2-2]
MNKWRGIFAIVITSAIALFGFRIFTHNPKETLIIAEGSQPVFALIYIAEIKGFFKDENLEISYKSFSSGRDALASVIAGESDLATVYETPVVLQTIAGHKLAIVTGLHNSSKNTALVARRDSGIELPQDLKGKKIGVTKNTNAEFFLDFFLKSHGMSKSDVILLDLKPYVMAPAIKRGVVDAVAIWNTHLYSAKKVLGDRKSVAFYSEVYTELSVLVGKQNKVKDRKEALQRCVRALARAEKFLQEKPQQAIDIVINHLSKIPKETIRNVWNDFNLELKLDNVLLTTLKVEANWFKEQGVFDEDIPDFRSIIYPEFLEVVKPKSVTIYN